MGSGTNGPSGLDSSSSLELALDQAIARRWASVHERSAKKRRNSPPPTTTATTTALAVSSPTMPLAIVPARLSWRGIEVTPEFQEYAARVARGEQLGPYRGEVLSRPCPEFPWSAPASTATPTPTLPEYPERGRSLKTVLWLGAAIVSIGGALGVGAAATSTSATDRYLQAFDDLRTAAAALKPAALPEQSEVAASLASLAPSVADLQAASEELDPPLASIVNEKPPEAAPALRSRSVTRRPAAVLLPPERSLTLAPRVATPNTSALSTAAASSAASLPMAVSSSGPAFGAVSSSVMSKAGPPATTSVAPPPIGSVPPAASRSNVPPPSPLTNSIGFGRNAPAAAPFRPATTPSTETTPGEGSMLFSASPSF